MAQDTYVHLYTNDLISDAYRNLDIGVMGFASIIADGAEAGGAWVGPAAGHLDRAISAGLLILALSGGGQNDKVSMAVTMAAGADESEVARATSHILRVSEDGFPHRVTAVEDVLRSALIVAQAQLGLSIESVYLATR